MRGLFSLGIFGMSVVLTLSPVTALEKSRGRRVFGDGPQGSGENVEDGMEFQGGRCRGAVVTLGDLVKRLEAQGIVFETPPQETDIVGAKGFALFRDPDGVLLELVEL